jgi:hypothetical protein
MPCFYLISDKDDFNQIPSRVSPMPAIGRKRTFPNARKRPIADIQPYPTIGVETVASLPWSEKACIAVVFCETFFSKIKSRPRNTNSYFVP